MTDDLVTRLRLAVNELYGTHPCGLMNDAADRIEQLEAALRKIACDGDPHFACFCDDPDECSYGIARAALEGKDG